MKNLEYSYEKLKKYLQQIWQKLIKIVRCFENWAESAWSCLWPRWFSPWL